MRKCKQQKKAKRRVTNGRIRKRVMAKKMEKRDRFRISAKEQQNRINWLLNRFKPKLPENK